MTNYDSLYITKGTLLGTYVFSATTRVTFTIPKVFQNTFFNKDEVYEIYNWEDPINPELVQVTVDLGETYKKLGLIKPEFFPKLKPSQEMSYYWILNGTKVRECSATKFLSQEAFLQTVAFIDIPTEDFIELSFFEHDGVQLPVLCSSIRIIFLDHTKDYVIPFIEPNLKQMASFEDDKKEFLKKNNEYLNNTTFIVAWLNRHRLSYLDCILKLPEINDIKDDNKDRTLLPYLWLRAVLREKNKETFDITLDRAQTQLVKDVIIKLDPDLTKGSMHKYHVNKAQFDLMNNKNLWRATKEDEKCKWISRNTQDVFKEIQKRVRVIIFSINITDSHLPLCILLNDKNLVVPESPAIAIRSAVVKDTDYNHLKDTSYIKTNNFCLYETNQKYTDALMFENVVTNWKEIHSVTEHIRDPVLVVCRAFVLEIACYWDAIDVPEHIFALRKFFKENKFVIDNTTVNSFHLPYSDLPKITLFQGQFKMVCNITKDDKTLLKVLEKVAKKVCLELFVVLPDNISLQNIQNKTLYTTDPAIVFFSRYEFLIPTQSIGFIQVGTSSYQLNNASTFVNTSSRNSQYTKNAYIDDSKNNLDIFSIIAQRFRLGKVDKMEEMLIQSLLWKGVQFAVSPWRRLYLEKSPSTIPIFQATNAQEELNFFENPISWFSSCEELIESRPLFVYWAKDSKPLYQISLSEYNIQNQSEIMGKAVLVGYCRVNPTSEPEKDIEIPTNPNQWSKINGDDVDNAVIIGHSHTELTSGLNLQNTVALYSCRFISCGSSKSAYDSKDLKKFFTSFADRFHLKDLPKFKDENVDRIRTLIEHEWNDYSQTNIDTKRMDQNNLDLLFDLYRHFIATDTTRTPKECRDFVKLKMKELCANLISTTKNSSEATLFNTIRSSL